MRNDLRILRRDFETLSAASGPRRFGPTSGAPTIVGKVVDDGNMPTSVPNDFLINIGTVGGPLLEGAPLTFTPVPGVNENVVVLGPGVPVAGDLLIARLAPGSRWVSESPRKKKKSPCKCMCVPRKLILDANVGLLARTPDPLPLLLSQLPFPVTLTWGAAPFTDLVLWSYGGQASLNGGNGLSASGGAFVYATVPAQAWFSEPLTIGPGMCQLWLYISGCVAFIYVVAPGSLTLPLNFGGSMTFDGILFSWPGQYLYFGGFAGMECDPYELDGFAWIATMEDGTFTAVGTEYIGLTGDASYYYYARNCIQLDANGRAGVGTIQLIPHGGYGQYGAGGDGVDIGGSG